jgi:hypothetical protein
MRTRTSYDTTRRPPRISEISDCVCSTRGAIRRCETPWAASTRPS